jgi:hypothetical protein
MSDDKWVVEFRAKEKNTGADIEGFCIYDDETHEYKVAVSIDWLIEHTDAPFLWEDLKKTIVAERKLDDTRPSCEA